MTIDLSDIDQIQQSCPACLGRVESCNHCGSTGRVSIRTADEWVDQYEQTHPLPHETHHYAAISRYFRAVAPMGIIPPSERDQRKMARAMARWPLWLPGTESTLKISPISEDDLTNQPNHA